METVSTCAVIGQFSDSYFAVGPAKFKSCFELKSSLYLNPEI